MIHMAKKPRPYAQYPTILRGKAEIAEFLRVSINSLPVCIDAGAPIRVVKNIFVADKLALRQWLGVQTYVPTNREGGGVR